MNTYLLWLNDQQAGPFTMTQLKSMWLSGQITAATLYWREEIQEWCSLGVLVENVIRTEKMGAQKSVVTEEPPSPSLGIGGFAVGVLVIGAGLWFFVKSGGLSGLERNVARQAIVSSQPTMDEIHKQVAADAVKQYEIAKRHGNAMDIHMQAMMVSAAFLQAGDEVNYRKWKEIEAEAAVAAGLPPNP